MWLIKDCCVPYNYFSDLFAIGEINKSLISCFLIEVRLLSIAENKVPLVVTAVKNTDNLQLVALLCVALAPLLTQFLCRPFLVEVSGMARFQFVRQSEFFKVYLALSSLKICLRRKFKLLAHVNK